MQSMVYLGSISRAMQAKRLLERQGVRAYVRQTTKETGGCGYSILIPSYSPQVASLLRTNGFLIVGGKERDVR